MQVYRYETPKEEIEQLQGPTVFLAGPTVRGNQQHLQPSWRVAAIEEFEKQRYDVDLIVPEFTDIAESDKGKEDIPIWEFAGLKRADCIMFWVPRTKELIGLTTNFELGYWIGRDRSKVIYGRPDDAYRVAYNDIMWKADFQENPRGTEEIFNTLSETVSRSVTKAIWIHSLKLFNYIFQR